MIKSGMSLVDLEDGYSYMVMKTIDISMNGKLQLLAYWRN